MRDVADAQESLLSPTLVDNVVVNAGPRTIIVLMGAYGGGFALSEDDKKGAMLHRWEPAPPDAPMLDMSVAEAAGWLTAAKKDGVWFCRCTLVHPLPLPLPLTGCLYASCDAKTQTRR